LNNNNEFPATSKGLKIIKEAQSLERQGKYDKAADKYHEAQKALDKKRNAHIYVNCLIAACINKIKNLFSIRSIEDLSHNADDFYIDIILKEVKKSKLDKVSKYDILISAYWELERVYIENYMPHKANNMYYEKSKLFHKKFWYKFLNTHIIDLRGWKELPKRLKEKTICLIRCIIHFIFSIFFGHGEKPIRALIITTSIVVAFSFIFSRFDLIVKSSCSNPLGYWESLYFSIVTFSTLGYGDILPRTSTGQLFIIFEVVIGYFMLGALVAIIIRKIAR
jgi:tetratricopeptide (TPR) repeat protein